MPTHKGFELNGLEIESDIIVECVMMFMPLTDQLAEAISRIPVYNGWES